MLRIQTALPDSYTRASSGELADRIAAAKATLGERLMILGHHYQRDDVMRWADARGDSFGLSRLAASNGHEGCVTPPRQQRKRFESIRPELSPSRRRALRRPLGRRCGR